MDITFTENTESIVLGSSATFLGNGGRDFYVLDPNLVPANAEIFITGPGTLRLPTGVSIASSKIETTLNIAFFIELTLTNGAVVHVDRADYMTFEVGGDTSGRASVEQTLEEFMRDTLGAAIPETFSPTFGGAVTIGPGDGPNVGSDVVLGDPADGTAITFTEEDDNIVLGTGAIFLGAGGTDTYVLDPNLVPSWGTEILIVDPSDSGVFRLPNGVSITSSQVLNVSGNVEILLTLTNETQVLLEDAQTYTFQTGGDTGGNGAITQTLTEFVEETLGASLPQLGGEATSGGPVTISSPGPDTIGGTNSADRLLGFSDDDKIIGFDGNDSLFGGDDNDTLFGGLGADEMDGGRGNDSLSGGEETGFATDAGLTDTLNGGDGDDTLNGFGSNSLLLGDAGDDNLLGGPDGLNDTLDGGTGADTMTGQAGADVYYVDNMGDVVSDNTYDVYGPDNTATGDVDEIRSTLSWTLRAWNDEGYNIENLTLLGGDDIAGTGNEVSNVLTGNAGNNVLVGGDGDDTFIGNAGHDRFWAGKDDTGDDSLDGGDGDDTMGGGAGNDTADGGEGSDEIFGGPGQDSLSGGPGWDKVWSGEQVDTVTGGAGNDTLGGGPDADSLSGGDGDDLLFAGKGEFNDTIDAGAGQDTVYANGGEDSLTGGAGADLFYNGAGNDTVDGGDGEDTIWGSPGDDSLTGGAGADRFMFVENFGDDTITDFDLGAERIELVGYPFDFPGVSLAATSNGGTVVQILGDSLTLEGVHPSALTDSHFSFA